MFASEPAASTTRPDLTRHELLSSSTAAAPLALTAAPQATLVVTTLADVVDASDGVLSLREAIDLANASPGLDTISFADELRGGRLLLDMTQGTLRITEDLRIDGDPGNGGWSGIVLDGQGPPFLGPAVPQPDLRTIFQVENATAHFEDLTITGGGPAGIEARDADIVLERGHIYTATASSTASASPLGAAVCRWSTAASPRTSASSASASF